MCNSANCSHDDLNDDLSDIFGSEPLTRTDIDAGINLARTQQVRGLIEETCKDCRGSGKFRGYTGRILGDCFKCKGTGKRYYRSTIEQREKAATQRAARKEREAQNTAEQAAAWKLANPNEAQWLREAAGRGFEFAVSLSDALHKYGHLTEKQEAAVRNATAKSLARKAEWAAENAARKAEWAAENAARDAAKADIDVSRIAAAFATAKGNGLKFPKLRLAGFTFSLAGANSRNAGSIYVKAGETYLGKVADAKFTRSRDCDAELEAAIIKAAGDPEAAATAYGLQTGICACCGAELTNPESVARGIGPICAGKWGF